MEVGGSTEPMGLDNMTGVYMRLHLGANGAALTGFEELGALWRKARELNHGVSAFVLAPRTLEEIRLLEDAHEAPKQNPFGEIPLVETNQVGITDTQGTSSNASKIFAGDFRSNVWAGWRYGSADSIKFLVDRSTLAEFGKVRIYAKTRMGLAYPWQTSNSSHCLLMLNLLSLSTLLSLSSFAISPTLFLRNQPPFEVGRFS